MAFAAGRGLLNDGAHDPCYVAASVLVDLSRHRRILQRLPKSPRMACPTAPSSCWATSRSIARASSRRLPVSGAEAGPGMASYAASRTRPRVRATAGRAKLYSPWRARPRFPWSVPRSRIRRSRPGPPRRSRCSGPPAAARQLPVVRLLRHLKIPPEKRPAGPLPGFRPRAHAGRQPRCWCPNRCP
ncbi:hypothetical protein AHiyo8_26710 [Arthrobacter sp. Hiyo8]|nr:hypothetical protein AHiyo8_26710 [Arthrobacter sp. Hiyo8]